LIDAGFRSRGKKGRKKKTPRRSPRASALVISKRRALSGRTTREKKKKGGKARWRRAQSKRGGEGEKGKERGRREHRCKQTGAGRPNDPIMARGEGKKILLTISPRPCQKEKEGDGVPIGDFSLRKKRGADPRLLRGRGGRKKGKEPMVAAHRSFGCARKKRKRRGNPVAVRAIGERGEKKDRGTGNPARISRKKGARLNTISAEGRGKEEGKYVGELQRSRPCRRQQSTGGRKEGGKSALFVYSEHVGKEANLRNFWRAPC